MKELPTLMNLLEVGAHFGHKKERSHPQAKKIIFGLRDGIYIIDLVKTRQLLHQALEYIKKVTSQGKKIVFVGTKRQAHKIIKEAAEKCGAFYINNRWFGGTLTNFDTIKKSIKRLNNLEVEVNNDEFKKITKKERLLKTKERNKLLNSLGGIKDMVVLPDVLFIVDTKEESTAVEEARKMNIPIVGICDTDANPQIINWPIPANDDSEKSIEILVDLVAEAVNEGKVKSEEKKTDDKEPETIKSTKDSK